MLRWILSLFAVMLASAGATKTPPARLDSTKECVFVLHGLAHGPGSMETLAARLSRAGYVVYNLAYPSTKGSFPEMVAVLARAVAAHNGQYAKVHFVAFSLGALVAREYLGEASLPRLGRVVLIAPPNHGSQMADSLGKAWLFRRLMGSVGTQLGTSPDMLPAQLPPPYYPVGVIAGDRSINPLGWFYMHGKHDGSVSVESARLDGMTDFLVVHRPHTLIIIAPEVADQTVYFLQNGSFQHQTASRR